MDRPEARALDGYARLYALLAVAMLLVSAQPLFAHLVHYETGGEQVAPRPSVWVDLVDSPVAQQEAVGLAAVLLIALLGLLTAGALGGRSKRVALGLAAAAALLGAVLIARPGFPDQPMLTAWGRTAIVLAIATAVLALAHRLHLWSLTTRTAEPDAEF